MMYFARGGALLLFLACTPTPVTPQGATLCDQACSQIEQLDCDFAGDSPHHQPCTVWLCDSNNDVLLCMSHAQSCPAAKQCSISLSTP